MRLVNTWNLISNLRLAADREKIIAKLYDLTNDLLSHIEFVLDKGLEQVSYLADIEQHEESETIYNKLENFKSYFDQLEDFQRQLESITGDSSIDLSNRKEDLKKIKDKLVQVKREVKQTESELEEIEKSHVKVFQQLAAETRKSLENYLRRAKQLLKQASKVADTDFKKDLEDNLKQVTDKLELFQGKMKQSRKVSDFKELYPYVREDLLEIKEQLDQIDEILQQVLQPEEDEVEETTEEEVESYLGKNFFDEQKLFSDETSGGRELRQVLTNIVYKKIREKVNRQLKKEQEKSSTNEATGDTLQLYKLTNDNEQEFKQKIYRVLEHRLFNDPPRTQDLGIGSEVQNKAKVYVEKLKERVSQLFPREVVERLAQEGIYPFEDILHIYQGFSRADRRENKTEREVLKTVVDHIYQQLVHVASLDTESLEENEEEHWSFDPEETKKKIERAVLDQIDNKVTGTRLNLKSGAENYWLKADSYYTAEIITQLREDLGFISTQQALETKEEAKKKQEPDTKYDVNQLRQQAIRDIRAGVKVLQARLASMPGDIMVPQQIRETQPEREQLKNIINNHSSDPVTNTYRVIPPARKFYLFRLLDDYPGDFVVKHLTEIIENPGELFKDGRLEDLPSVSSVISDNELLYLDGLTEAEILNIVANHFQKEKASLAEDFYPTKFMGELYLVPKYVFNPKLKEPLIEEFARGVSNLLEGSRKRQFEEMSNKYFKRSGYIGLEQYLSQYHRMRLPRLLKPEQLDLDIANRKAVESRQRADLFKDRLVDETDLTEEQLQQSGAAGEVEDLQTIEDPFQEPSEHLKELLSFIRESLSAVFEKGTQEYADIHRQLIDEATKWYLNLPELTLEEKETELEQYKQDVEDKIESLLQESEDDNELPEDLAKTVLAFSLKYLKRIQEARPDQYPQLEYFFKHDPERVTSVLEEYIDKTQEYSSKDSQATSLKDIVEELRTGKTDSFNRLILSPTMQDLDTEWKNVVEEEQNQAQSEHAENNDKLIDDITHHLLKLLQSTSNAFLSTMIIVQQEEVERLVRNKLVQLDKLSQKDSSQPTLQQIQQRVQQQGLNKKDPVIKPILDLVFKELNLVEDRDQVVNPSEELLRQTLLHFERLGRLEPEEYSVLKEHLEKSPDQMRDLVEEIISGLEENKKRNPQVMGIEDILKDFETGQRLVFNAVILEPTLEALERITDSSQLKGSHNLIELEKALYQVVNAKLLPIMYKEKGLEELLKADKEVYGLVDNYLQEKLTRQIEEYLKIVQQAKLSPQDVLSWGEDTNDLAVLRKKLNLDQIMDELPEFYQDESDFSEFDDLEEQDTKDNY